MIINFSSFLAKDIPSKGGSLDPSPRFSLCMDRLTWDSSWMLDFELSFNTNHVTIILLSWWPRLIKWWWPPSWINMQITGKKMKRNYYFSMFRNNCDFLWWRHQWWYHLVNDKACIHYQRTVVPKLLAIGQGVQIWGGPFDISSPPPPSPWSF